MLERVKLKLRQLPDAFSIYALQLHSRGTSRDHMYMSVWNSPLADRSNSGLDTQASPLCHWADIRVRGGSHNFCDGARWLDVELCGRL